MNADKAPGAKRKVFWRNERSRRSVSRDRRRCACRQQMGERLVLNEAAAPIKGGRGRGKTEDRRPETEDRRVWYNA